MNLTRSGYLKRSLICLKRKGLESKQKSLSTSQWLSHRFRNLKTNLQNQEACMLLLKLKLMDSLILSLKQNLKRSKYSMLNLKCFIRKLWKLWLIEMKKSLISTNDLETTSLSFKRNMKGINSPIQRQEKARRNSN